MIIGNSKVSDDNATYIVAELSANHNGSLEKAIEMVRRAKESGANAIKLQTYTPDTITIDCDNKHFRIDSGTIWDGQTLYRLYEKAYTPWEWHRPLQKEANRLGLDFFSSPFDESAVDFLETLKVPCYKIASFEVTDTILLKKVAKTGKPVILSTGATELPEIAEAVKILREGGTNDICILKCTSAYPAPIEDANLKTIKNIKETFHCVAGLSDHTLGIEVPIAAVCLGANFIEKHFTLNRDDGGPDSQFSLEPDEFKAMVESIRKVEKAIGKIKYEKSDREKKSYKFKRSLYITDDIKKGDTFTRDNLRSIRPGNGLHTRHYEDVLGRVSRCDIDKGTPLSWDLVG